MKVLAIETSTSFGSVALVEHQKVLAFESSHDQRKHSEFVNSAIEKVLTASGCRLSEIDGFAVGIGPGSFTGIRVALNVARTFALTFSKPLIGKDALTLLQYGVHERCICMINAYKNMVYWAVFENGKMKDGPAALSVTDVEARLSQIEISQRTLCLGDGFTAYESFFSPQLKQLLKRDSSIFDFPRADALGLSVASEPHSSWTNDWKSIIPLYIRASEAEENSRKT